MNQNSQNIKALRLALDLEAIAQREGISFLDVLDMAGADPAQFVRDWIKLHYFDLE